MNFVAEEVNRMIITATTCYPSGHASGSGVVAGDLSGAEISFRADK